MRHVLLIQLDGRLPNLALMRISAWHRSLGDMVHFARSPYRQLDYPAFDAVYGSAIFKFSADQVDRFQAEWPGAFVGGTGTDSKLTLDDIPGFVDCGVDYEFYPEFAASIGFTQRGCRLCCKFCVVPGKEGRPVSVSTVGGIWRGHPYPKHLHLLDNDFFGQSEDQWRARIAEMREGDFKVSFTQGINVRAMTEEVAAALATIEYRDDAFARRRLYTAWDNLKDEDVFFRGVDLLRRHGIPPSHLMVFMLVGFDKRETWDRIFHRFNRMVEIGIRPYPMVFDHTRRDLKRFQRWVVTGLYRAVPFDQYDASKKAARSVDDTGQASAF